MNIYEYIFTYYCSVLKIRCVQWHEPLWGQHSINITNPSLVTHTVTGFMRMSSLNFKRTSLKQSHCRGRTEKKEQGSLPRPPPADGSLPK